MTRYIDYTHGDVRIGVFVCHCGTNIGGVVDVPSVVEYAKTLPCVVHVEKNLYTCAEDGLNTIKTAIKKYRLNRVIVASCTPRTHAPLFMSACQAAGLNPYLFEFVNIRDQCSWVHMHEKEKATEKAKHLVKMGVAKAILLEPLEKVHVGVVGSVLVIGGGISGMTAAKTLASYGFDVYLVEKEDSLGGLVKKFHKVFPIDKGPSTLLDPLIKSIKSNQKIKVFLSSKVTEVKGYIGNFDVTVTERGKNDLKVKVGIIVVATGALPLTPQGLYGYGEYENVITQIQLEDALKNNDAGGIRFVMIQCVGSRGQKVDYCSKICCMTAIKNAVAIKEINPNSEVTILYRDIQMHGVEAEELYRKSRRLGVRFIRYTPTKLPLVMKANNGLKVKVHDVLLDQNIEISCDRVILSTPLIQHEAGRELAKTLRLATGPDDFFYEAHVKLRPIDFSTDGIFLCGTAHGPKDIQESISQALGVASRAAPPLIMGEVESEPIISVIDPELCVGCGNCLSLCPYNAITMKERNGSLVSESNPLLCKGCGVCAVECPSHAIKMQYFTDAQIIAQISAALDNTVREDEPNIIGFCCNWCSYAGADMAGVSRFQYSPNIKIIRVMCSGRVDPNHILWAFLNGADGVFVSGCHPGDCHYVSGNIYAEERIEKLKASLKRAGINPERLRLEWISASEGKRFADLVTKFTEQIKRLGPNPLRMKRKVVVNV